MIHDMVQKLIGCSWGRVVASTDGDDMPCPDQATRVAVLYDGDVSVQVRLCPKHMSRVLEESTPREFKDGESA